jgi:hypothetical protein
MRETGEERRDEERGDEERLYKKRWPERYAIVSASYEALRRADDQFPEAACPIASRLPCTERRRRAARAVRAERSVADVAYARTLARDVDVRIPGLFWPFRVHRRAPTARPAPTEATLRKRRTNHASTPRPLSASANVRRDYRDYPSD